MFCLLPVPFFACFKYPITILPLPSLPPTYASPPTFLLFLIILSHLVVFSWHSFHIYVCSKPLFLRMRYLQVPHSNCYDVFVHYFLDLKGRFCLCQHWMNQTYIFIRSNSWFAVLWAWCKLILSCTSPVIRWEYAGTVTIQVVTVLWCLSSTRLEILHDNAWWASILTSFMSAAMPPEALF